MTLTYPEAVTPHNYKLMMKLVENGRNKHPGANFVILASRGPNSEGTFDRIDLRHVKFIDLKYGDIVERHLISGDVVLFNRQPSLHKMSMMAHRIRVINNKNLASFRLNECVTSPYNAD